ncbi:MAG TPA: lipocalin family protein [Bacteroidota bacterium]|nr:lipocalin family protein [Bacteroidota bacterium]
MDHIVTAMLIMTTVTVPAIAQTQNGSLGELTVVAKLDIGRYMGTWYEVARLPNSFQTKCAGDVTATYTLRADGAIDVVNKCRLADGTMSEAIGRAKQADEDGPNTKLKVRFAPAWLSLLPFVWGDYWVIDLAPDYSSAVIGEPRRKYLWVLSRTPQIDETRFNNILAGVKKQGYDLTNLIRTVQSGK